MQVHVPKCRNRATYMRYKCKYSFVVSVKPSVVFKRTKRFYSKKKKKKNLYLHLALTMISNPNLLLS